MPNLFLFAFKLSYLLITLFMVSVLSYVGIYKLYIPNFRLIKPIHFQHDIACNQLIPVENKLPNCLQTKFTSSYKCHFVFDDIQFNGNFFVPSQLYDFEVHLEFPDSDTNHNLGMFMVKMELFDLNDNSMFDVSRPAMLPYRSYAVRLAKKIVLIVPYMMGYLQETHLLKIRLIDEDNVNMEQVDFTSIGRIHIEIQTYLPIEIMANSKLHIKANLSGIVYMMYFWPATTSVLITFLIYSTLLFVYFFILFCRMLSRAKPVQPRSSRYISGDIDANELLEFDETNQLSLSS